MWLAHWLRRRLTPHRTRGSAARARSPRSASHRICPRLEYLEERVVPAFNLTISNATTVGVTQVGGAFTASSTAANINVSDLLSALNAGNDLTISNGPTGTEAGDIVWQAGASLTYTNAAARSLTLTADASSISGTITLSSAISGASTTLNESFNAQGALAVNAALNTGAGNLSLSSARYVRSASPRLPARWCNGAMNSTLRAWSLRP